MKEMCKNFICNGTCGMQPEPPADMPAAENCNACVMEHIGLAQAFVPFQPAQMPMEQEQSLVCGTAFSDLVMPYCSGWNLYRFGKEV